MSFYSDLTDVASRILGDKGQIATITQTVSAGFDPATGTNIPDSEITFTGYGASFGYNKSEIDGALIQNGDIRFMFEATTIEPTVGNTTVIDDITYRVMNVNKTAPDGTVVKYELQLRR